MGTAYGCGSADASVRKEPRSIHGNGLPEGNLAGLARRLLEARDAVTEAEAPVAHYEFPILGRAYFLGGRASTSIKQALVHHGVSEETIQRVAVACYEAEMNVVLHARSGYARVEVYADRVVVMIHDRGPGIENIAQAMTPGWSSASDEARALGFGAGMGLPNIKAHADDMQITSEPGQGVNLVLVFAKREEP